MDVVIPLDGGLLVHVIIASTILSLLLLLFCYRLIETDSKSLNSLSTQSVGSAAGAGHSRKSSDTSQVSANSRFRLRFCKTY